jgi:hypothetical protein
MGYVCVGVVQLCQPKGVKKKIVKKLGRKTKVMCKR